jgi:hypothetical protein
MNSLMELEENSRLKVLFLWKSSPAPSGCVPDPQNYLNLQHCVSKFKKMQQ